MQINTAPKIETRPQFNLSAMPRSMRMDGHMAERLAGAKWMCKDPKGPLQCLRMSVPQHASMSQVLDAINRALPADSTGLHRIDVNRYFPELYDITIDIQYYGPLQMKGESHDPIPTTVPYTDDCGRRHLPRGTATHRFSRRSKHA